MRAKAKKTKTTKLPNVSRSSFVGGSGGPIQRSGGYDANMNGPYGNGPTSGVDYPSSWHGPNEPGGSLDI
jgi:hypothetical protein